MDWQGWEDGGRAGVEGDESQDYNMIIPVYLPDGID